MAVEALEFLIASVLFKKHREVPKQIEQTETEHPEHVAENSTAAVKTTKEEKAEPEQPKMTRLASKYGMLRKTYLQEHRKGLYLELVFAGKLNEHLHQIDEECNQMMDRLVEQMKEKQGVTEELKMQDQMAWVGGMNNIRACGKRDCLCVECRVAF